MNSDRNNHGIRIDKSRADPITEGEALGIIIGKDMISNIALTNKKKRMKRYRFADVFAMYFVYFTDIASMRIEHHSNTFQVKMMN